MQRSPRRLALGLLCVLLLAGCVGGSTSKARAPTTSSASVVADGGDVETGEILGRVLDDEFQLLAGVTVAIAKGDRSATTAEDGVFFFKEVPVGSYKLLFTKHGYASKDTDVDVVVRQRTPVEVFMVRAADQNAFMDAGFTFRGTINCSVRGNASGTSTNPECGAVQPDQDQSRGTFLEYAPGIRYSLIEIEWVPSVPVVNEQLTLTFRPFVGEVWKEVPGSSPIRYLITPDDWASIQKATDKDYPGKGGQLQVYVYPGELQNQAGLGVGAAVSQDFTLYMTNWYRMDADPTFSRVSATG